jgi:S-phase kinase-associated protein 1
MSDSSKTTTNETTTTTTNTTTTTTTTNTTTDSQKTVKLVSSDGKELIVPFKQIQMSITLKHIMDDCPNLGIPISIPNVDFETLTKVIEFLSHYEGMTFPKDTTNKNTTNKDTTNKDTTNKDTTNKDTTNKDIEINTWDKKFLNIKQENLFSLILAANYLDIQELLNKACKTVAEMIKGKKAEEIRQTFKIKNDFTPDEEEQVRKENDWCEDK